jgi:hypothetical protein
MARRLILVCHGDDRPASMIGGPSSKFDHFTTTPSGLFVAEDLAQRSYVRLVPAEIRVGYQKAGLLSVAKEHGVFERLADEYPPSG